MKTIGLLLNKINDKISPHIGDTIRILKEIADCQICLFANKTMNIPNIDICMMSIGTIVNFTGDVICFNSDDALLCIQSNRDMNIKYLLTSYTMINIVDLLPHYDRIEFLILNEDHQIMKSSLIGDKFRTIREYFDEKR